MSGSGQETLLDVRTCSGDPPGGPEVFGRLSRRSKTGREALTDVQKWLRDPPGDPEVVGGSPGGQELVGRPSRRSGRGPSPSWWSESVWETLPEVRKWSEALQVVRNW